MANPGIIMHAGKAIDAVSMASSITGTVVDLGNNRDVSVHFVAASSGTHVGTGAVQASNDGTNFVAVTLSATPTASSGSAWNDMVRIKNFPTRFLRVVYTATSGTGTLTVSVYSK